MTYLGMWVYGQLQQLRSVGDSDNAIIASAHTTSDLSASGRWEAMYDAESIVLEQACIFAVWSVACRDDLFW